MDLLLHGVVVLPQVEKRLTMATLTATKKRVKADVDVDDEVESKAEPDVIVDKGLGNLLKEWHQADRKAESYFLRIIEYVQENDISRQMLKKGLIEMRGMAELTANNEVSKVFKCIEQPDLVQQAVDKKITVRELRDRVTKRQEGTDDPEQKLKKRLRLVATFAISEDDLNYDEGQFLRESKRAYKDAYAKIEAKAERQSEDGEDGEEDEGDEEE